MKKTIFFTVMSLLCLNFWAQAQDKTLAIKPLKIGERVPDLLWNTPMTFYKNGKYITETLHQFKGKVILFDFWASWCGNCIEGFPKLKQLQDSLGDGLQIILVNQKSVKDSNQAIEQVFQTNKLQLGNLPTVVQDTILHQLFSTYALPSYAVVTGDLDLAGITSGFLFNEAGINDLVAYRAKLLKIREKFKVQKGRGIK